MFRYCHIPVSDADAIVHRLLEDGGEAAPAVADIFPQVIENNAVNRKKLGEIVFADNDKMQVLEGILHPLVKGEHKKFINMNLRYGSPLVVLDIPLLFETGADVDCDAVTVVTAPEFIQRQRALARSGIDEQRFSQIISRQMPDREKRRRADFIIHTGLGKAHSMSSIREIIRNILL